MADKVGVKVVVDGESEFRASIKNINNEMKTLTSELKLVDSEFRGQANTMAALTAKHNILQKEYDQQKAKVEALNKAYQKANEVYGENGAKTEEYKQKLNYAKVALNNLDDELKKNNKYLDEVKKSTDGCATSLNKFGKETNEAAEKGGLLGKIFAGGFFANIAAQAVTFLASKLKDFATQGLELASNLTEVQNVVDTTFGDRAGIIDDWASTAATAFGLSELNAKKYTSTLGAMLKSAGIAGSELTDMSTKLAGVAADFASFYNLGIDESFDKIRQAIGGETEGLKQLGINLNQSNLMQTEYAKNLNKSWTEMTVAEQATARYNAILELGNDALGDFSKTSDSYANKLKIMQLESENLKTVLGEKLLPVATDVVDGITAMISGFNNADESFAGLSKSLESAKNTQELIDNYQRIKTEMGDTALTSEDLSQKTEELKDAKQALIDASNGVITTTNIENGTFDEQVKVLENATDSEKNYIKFKLEAIALENTGAGALKKSAEARKDYNEVLKYFNAQQAAIDDAKDQIAAGKTRNELGVKYTEIIKNGSQALEWLRSDLTDATTKMSDTAESASQGEASIKSLVDNGFMSAKEAAAEFALEISDVNAILGDTSGAAADSIPEIQNMAAQISALNTEYQTAYDSALQSLQGQYDLWSNAPTIVATSVEAMQAALDSNTEYFTNYKANIETLLTLDIPGVDMQPLIDSISDGTPEAAARAQGLADAIKSGNTDAVAALAQSAVDAKASQDALAAEMGKAATDYDKRMQDIFNSTVEAVKGMDQTEEAIKSGKNTLIGYINGVNSESPTLNITMSAAAQAALNSWKKVFDEHSPSKEMEKSGENDIKGAIIGVNNMQAALVETYTQMGVNLMTGLSTGMKNSAGKAMSTADDVGKELSTRLGDILSVFSTSSDVSELKYSLWEMTSGKSVTGEEKTRKQLESINEQAEIEKQQIKSLETALSKMTQLYGANSEESLKLQKQLLQEQIAYEKLKKSIQEVSEAKTSVDTDKLANMADEEYKLWYLNTPDASDTEKLEKQSEVLTFKLGLQGETVSETESALAAMVKQYGANSDESIKLQEQLLKEKIAYAELKKQIDEVNDAMSKNGLTGKTSSGFLQVANMWNSLNGSNINTDMSSLNGAKKTDISGVVASAVNAVGTITGQRQPIIIQNPLYINGRKLAEATVHDFRAVDSSSPKVVSDRL